MASDVSGEETSHLLKYSLHVLRYFEMLMLVGDSVWLP